MHTTSVCAPSIETGSDLIDPLTGVGSICEGERVIEIALVANSLEPELLSGMTSTICTTVLLYLFAEASHSQGSFLAQSQLFLCLKWNSSYSIGPFPITDEVSMGLPLETRCSSKVMGYHRRRTCSSQKQSSPQPSPNPNSRGTIKGRSSNLWKEHGTHKREG